MHLAAVVQWNFGFLSHFSLLNAGTSVTALVLHECQRSLPIHLSMASLHQHCMYVGLRVTPTASVPSGQLLCGVYQRLFFVQVLGNRGPLSARDPGQVFATSARDCKIPQHGDDLEAVVPKA